MANPNPNPDTQFKKGESGNPNGRPRKSFGQINEDLKQQGIEPLKKVQFIEAYTLIFNATEGELKVLADDKENVPLVLRLIIAELSDKKTRSRALIDYRDYMFGRPVQQTELVMPENITAVVLNVIKPKEEKKDE